MVREWNTCLTREAKPICRTKAVDGSHSHKFLN